MLKPVLNISGNTITSVYSSILNIFLANISFVNSQQAGAVRDSAASAYVMNNRKGNATEVLKVAESITEKDARERAVRVSAIRLITEDPVAGNTYIQGSDLFSDEMKTRAAEGKPIWGGTRSGGGPGGRGGRGGN